MTAFFAFLAGLFQAIPILDSWFSKFAVFYLAWLQERNQTKFREVLRDTIAKCDQRDLEAGGISGVPSGHAGVQDRPRKP